MRTSQLPQLRRLRLPTPRHTSMFDERKYMRKIAILLFAAILSGCATLPPEYAKSPDKSLVIGKTANGVQTQIRSVDDGEVLFVKGYQLGNQVWLSPGPHKLSISCVKVDSWGSMIDHKDISLNVKLNHTYELQASFAGKEPSVAIKEIPNP